MKKIFAILLTLFVSQSILFAQNGTKVSEKDVPERYVRDFQRLAPDVKDVEWQHIDSLVYDAYYENESGTLTAYRFSPKGTETRWYIESRYYPHAILDYISANYPNYKIKELYVLMIKNKATYRALIGKRKGFFTKRWRNMRYINFETDYKFIDEIEL